MPTLARIASRIVRRSFSSPLSLTPGDVAVARHAVVVRRRLEVELVLRLDQAVALLAVVELAEQLSGSRNARSRAVKAQSGNDRLVSTESPVQVNGAASASGPERQSETSWRPTRSGFFEMISWARPMERVGKLLVSTSRTICPFASMNSFPLVALIAGLRSAPR